MLHIFCTQLLTSSGTCSVTDMTFTQLTCRMGHPMIMSIIYSVYRLVKFSILFSPKMSYTYWDNINTSADEKPRLEKVAKCIQHVHVYACNALQFNINFPSMPHLQRGWFRFNWKQINELCRKFKKLGRSAKRIMKRLWIWQLCFKIGKYICIHMRFLKFRYFLYHGRLAVNL